MNFAVNNMVLLKVKVDNYIRAVQFNFQFTLYEWLCARARCVSVV